jgi:hypothetical protein
LIYLLVDGNGKSQTLYPALFDFTHLCIGISTSPSSKTKEADYNNNYNDNRSTALLALDL